VDHLLSKENKTGSQADAIQYKFWSLKKI